MFVELYHALNRGVEKRNIFMDERDFVRFIHDLWEFNDADPTSHAIHSFKNLDLRNPNFPDNGKKRIVDLHAWCLMKNHYHLLLSECVEGGLVLFLRKLNVGYANYFNERYKRSGALFQGRTKKVLVHSEAHFLHILHYIHLNPLDYFSGAKEWRQGHVNDPTKAKAYLDRYRWSSYGDYCGRKNFPSIVTKEFFTESIGNVEKETLAYLEKTHEASDTLPQRFLE